MSYKYHYKDDEVEGVRKVRWDGLWHVLYILGGRETYDRVTRGVALRIEKKLSRRR